MGKISTHCLLFLVLFSGQRMVIEAKCNGIIKVSRESSGSIQSPNFGEEYGKSANCSWEFTSPSGNKAFLLTLTVTKLKTFFLLNGKKVCSGSYNLTINYAPTECTRYADSEYNSSYCIAYYSSSTCASLASSKNCKVSQMTSFPIPVTYISDGRTDDTRTGLLPSHVWGFKMQHEYVECPSATSTTIQQMATTAATTTTTTAPQDSNAEETTAREITQEQSLSATSTAKEKTTYKTFTTNSEASSAGERTSEIAQTTSATSTLKSSKVSMVTKNQSIATEETASSQVLTEDSAHKSTATAFYAATNPETQKSKVILISAAAGGGGLLIIVILVVTIVCIRKRNHKNLPLNGPSENHELAEQQSQPHEVNHNTEVVQSEERTSELPASSTVNESVTVTVPAMSVEEDDNMAYYTTMRGAAPIRHNPTVNIKNSTSPCSGDNPNDSDGGERPYSIISGAASINQSDNEMYCTLDRQGQPEGVYTMMGENMPVNQSDQLVNSAENRSQMQQTVHDQSETNIEEGALYSAVIKSDGKKTVRYQKTMVDNVLYGTAP